MEDNRNISLGGMVKIKRGAKIFYNFGSNSLKYDRKKGFVISQIHESLAKTTGKCYTKQISYDLLVEIVDPEITFHDLIFCRVRLNDEEFHILKADLVGEKEDNKVPPKDWNVKI